MRHRLAADQQAAETLCGASVSERRQRIGRRRRILPARRGDAV